MYVDNETDTDTDLENDMHVSIDIAKVTDKWDLLRLHLLPPLEEGKLRCEVASEHRSLISASGDLAERATFRLCIPFRKDVRQHSEHFSGGHGHSW